MAKKKKEVKSMEELLKEGEKFLKKQKISKNKKVDLNKALKKIVKKK